jgi:glycosyltransferase involved in cell wall biosynthesis
MVAPCAVELALAAAWFDADIYHANDLDTLVPACWAARLRGTSYIYDAHELYAEESPLLGPAERAARSTVEKKLARGARAVLTVNDLLAEELARRYQIPRPVAVRNVPPLVALGPREPALPIGQSAAPGPLRLLLHGSWVGLEQPGVEAALQAVARLPGVRLTLRGGVRNHAALRVRLGELGIADRVMLRPRLPGADALVRAAIAEQHDVGLSVHLPDCLSRQLATSSKVFEYLMAGLAVVAAEQEGNRHILDERCATFFTPGDADDLARVLAALAADRPRLRAAQLAARARAEAEFCWERERERLLSLYC